MPQKTKLNIKIIEVSLMKKYRDLFLTKDEVRQLIGGYCEQNNDEPTIRGKRNKKIRKYFQVNMLALTNTNG